jgi:glycosyltransferase involved in cell wall biosynthesis
MSYGNCVIGNGTPENLEVIGDAGLSFAKNDFMELSQILSRVLADPRLVEEYGQKAKARALSRYSWDAIVDRYERLFFSLRRA